MANAPTDPSKIIYIPFLMMPFLMGFVAQLVVPSPEGGFIVSLPDGTNMVHLAMAMIGVMTTVASVALGVMAPPSPAGAERRAATPEPRWLIRLALAESVAVCGLVATIVAQRPGAWVPFSIFSFAAMLAARPR